MNTYEYQFAALCPENSESIIYDLTIISDGKIMVEEIKNTCWQLNLHQEDIASLLENKFPGSNIKLSATHHGVRIISTL